MHQSTGSQCKDLRKQHLRELTFQMEDLHLWGNNMSHICVPLSVAVTPLAKRSGLVRKRLFAKWTNDALSTAIKAIKSGKRIFFVAL